MKKIFNKYSCCVFFFFIGSFVMLVEAQPPPGVSCCLNYEGKEEYDECIDFETDNPGLSYCDRTLPIDNSLYIYLSMVAAVAIASFVIARRIKT